MTRPFFSVIIPTCNRKESLILCLDLLSQGQQIEMHLIDAGKTNDSNHQANTYEVIISDDSKDTCTQAWIETHYPWARYSRGPQKGPAANRNNAAKQAHGTWLIFTDDDCLPEPNWLKSYNEGIRNNPQAQALEGSILPAEKVEGDLVACPSNENGGNFWSANILIFKSLYDEIGGFDTFFPYAKMEDIDLYLRLKRHTEIPFVQSAVIKHPAEKLSLIKSIKREFRGISSHGYLLAKHPKELKSNNILQLLFYKYKTYLRWTFNALSQFHLKRFFVLLLCLTGELPLVSGFYLYHKHKTLKK